MSSPSIFFLIPHLLVALHTTAAQKGSFCHRPQGDPTSFLGGHSGLLGPWLYLHYIFMSGALVWPHKVHTHSHYLTAFVFFLLITSLKGKPYNYHRPMALGFLCSGVHFDNMPKEPKLDQFGCLSFIFDIKCIQSTIHFFLTLLFF